MLLKVHEIISSKTNKNGVVIDSLSRVIYLGKSCDAVVLGEEKVKSIWYKDGEQFVIVHKDNDGLLQEDYRFYLDDKVAKLNCDKPIGINYLTVLTFEARLFLFFKIK